MGKISKLLAAIVRDCGASCNSLPPGEFPADPETLHAKPPTSASVAAAIIAALAAGGPTLGADILFRISLGDAQKKTALLWHNNAWHRALGIAPHILKRPLDRVGIIRIDLGESVNNEWRCG